MALSLTRPHLNSTRPDFGSNPNNYLSYDYRYMIRLVRSNNYRYMIRLVRSFFWYDAYFVNYRRLDIKATNFIINYWCILIQKETGWCFLRKKICINKRTWLIDTEQSEKSWVEMMPKMTDLRSGRVGSSSGEVG